ncbi:MAG TPA: GatB/YqeY domain-containing protein [Candidatus Absconditabacterales bacterium]|nr:GatB/YqeY domain-containing protein [Candidatus Absconditabacterales bacterium]
MSLQEQLLADYKQAMMQKDKIKKTILNYVIAQIKNKKIELQKDLEDVDVIKILKKEVKALGEAIGFLEKTDKKDELAEEKAKKVLLEFYLPQTKSKEETKKIVKEIIASQGIDDLQKQRGQLMGAIMGQYKGEIDGAIVNEVVNEMLSK